MSKTSLFATAGTLTGSEIIGLLQSATNKQTTLDLIKAFIMAGGLADLLAVDGDVGTQNINFSTKVANSLLMLDGSKNVDYSPITLISGELDLTGVLMKLGNVYSASGRPSFTAAAGAGTGPTITIDGTNECGKITVNTGTGPGATANIGVLTFSALTYPNNSVPVISAANANAHGVMSTIYATGANTGITLINGGAALAATTVYEFYYLIKGY